MTSRTNFIILFSILREKLKNERMVTVGVTYETGNKRIVEKKRDSKRSRRTTGTTGYFETDLE